MAVDVLCLRPEADFERVDALPPPTLKVAYLSPDENDVSRPMREARALGLPEGVVLLELLGERCVVIGAPSNRADQHRRAYNPPKAA